MRIYRIYRSGIYTCLTGMSCTQLPCLCFIYVFTGLNKRCSEEEINHGRILEIAECYKKKNDPRNFSRFRQADKKTDLTSNIWHSFYCRYMFDQGTENVTGPQKKSGKFLTISSLFFVLNGSSNYWDQTGCQYVSIFRFLDRARIKLSYITTKNWLAIKMRSWRFYCLSFNA